nr:hypothetical protein ANI_1_800114 [Aspergillus niger CBS 513.88]|eukprot:XP_001396471.2 hypothetical protein ANI_1_800114 [Aspergillus niger CBS 513.88]
MPPPEYVFPRDYLDNNRINLQHYLSTEIFGYFLHPDIPVQNPNLKIADIAAGTNRSPLSYATFSLGAYTQYVPKESKGVYDIVHVRNVVFVLSDQGIEDILSKVFGLIKPGGYTQWGEVDIHYLRIDKINEECSTSALEEIVRITRSADPRLVPHWDPELPRLFESIGLVDIKKETREGPGYMDYMLHECVLMAHDIIVRNTNNKEVGQRLHGILL